MNSTQALWAEYRETMAGMAPAALSVGDTPPKPDEASVDRMLEASEKLGNELAGKLRDDRPDVRELAALQLEAAAAVDLDRANALAAADDEEGLEATLSGTEWTRIDRILDTPTENGIVSVIERGGGFRATAAEEADLKEVVNKAIDAIAADAAKASSTTVKGLVGIPGDEAKKAFGDGVEKVFERLGDKINWLKRKAVALVLKAVKKLLSIFGTSTDALQKKIDKWLDELNEEKIKGLLERLYGVEGLKGTYGDRLAKAGTIPEDRDAAARKELDRLASGWHVRAEIIGTIGGIAPLARKWIWKLAPPAGGIAYMIAFATATGYVVLAGGDYLDWREDDGVLDLVDGVGAVVNRAAGTTVPTS